ncbi:hypothetical protein BDV19DRAFT_386838 [Aspergillus venezuelensis]
MAEHYQTAIEAATTAALAASNAAQQAAIAAAQYANAIACKDIPAYGVFDQEDVDLLMEEYAAAASVAAVESAEASGNARRAAEIALEAAERAKASAVIESPVTSSEEYTESSCSTAAWLSTPATEKCGCDEFDVPVSFTGQNREDDEWKDIQGALNTAALEYLESMMYETDSDSDTSSDDSSSTEALEEWAALKESWTVEQVAAQAEYIAEHLKPATQPSKPKPMGTQTPKPLPILSRNENKKLGDWTGGLLVKHDKHRTVHSAYGKITEILPFKTLVVVEETPNYPASGFLRIPNRYLHNMAEIEYTKPIELGGLALGLLRCDEPGDELKYGLGKVVAVRRDASVYLVSNGMEDMGVDVCEQVVV